MAHDQGRYRGRVRQRLFSFRPRGRTFIATLRTALPTTRHGGREVWVLSSSAKLLGLLGTSVKQRHDRFREAIAGAHNGSRTTRAKAYIDRRESRPDDVLDVVYLFGPYSALIIGEIDDTLLAVTPTLDVDASRMQPSERALVQRVIGEHFDDCLETYFLDVADMLAQVFAFGQTEAARTLCDVGRLLRLSVLPKIELFKTATHEQQAAPHDSRPAAETVEWYRAASSVTRALSAQLQVALGIRGSYESSIERAFAQLATIEDGDVDSALLSECLRRDARTPPDIEHGRTWTRQLFRFSRLLQRVLALHERSPARPTRIFLTHQHKVWASAVPANEIRSRCRQLNNGQLFEIPALSEQAHSITDAIRATLWASDGHAFLIPNDLTQTDKTQKTFQTSNDFCIEEFILAQSFDLDSSFIVAKNGGEDILRKLSTALDGYDAQSIDDLRDDRSYRRAKEILHQIIQRKYAFVEMESRESGLAPEFDNELMRLLWRVEARRFRTLVRSLRGSVSKDEWTLLCLLRHLGIRTGAGYTEEVTLSQLVSAYPRARINGDVANERTVARVLREIFARRGLRIGDRFTPAVRVRGPHVCFNLDNALERAQDRARLYSGELPIKITEIYETELRYDIDAE